MGFYDVIRRFDAAALLGAAQNAQPRDVEAALDRERPTLRDFAVLLSDAAAGLLEPMAQKARLLTRSHFGSAVVLFTPLYISNYCDSVCAYCSFGRNHRIERMHLSPEQIAAEAQRISETGMRHILVLTGEARKIATIDYLREAMAVLRDRFCSIAIEVYPMTRDEYGVMVESGVDSLTIYQEVYDEQAYHRYHAGGPKDNYAFRIEAPERACDAGMHAVTIGSLLGLGSWRSEALATAAHLDYLRTKYPGVEMAVSLPRMRPLAGDFTPPYPVGDRQFVQMLLAFRLFAPEVGITLSTREQAEFRDAVLPLGVTKVSAGVSTAVGGRSGKASTTQFEIADTRSVEEMKDSLLRLGYQPVMHDWSHRLTGGFHG